MTPVTDAAGAGFGFSVSRAESRGEARAILLAATPPNSSFTQQRNFSVDQIDRALTLGFRRAEWVWTARDSAGTVVATVAGWGSAERTTPFILDFLDLPIDSPEIARAILDRAVADSCEPGRATMEIIHFLPSESELDDPDVSALVSLLAAAGFRLLVRRHRYRLDVHTDTVAIPDTALEFVPLASADDPRLPAVLAEILVGSLDAHDVDALRRADLHTVARDTAAEYLEMDPFDSMFLALDPTIAAAADHPVGLVIGGLRGAANTGSASFIGVSHRHRGHGYAAQLLGWITRRLIGAGAEIIVGETDDDNFPMAAAFTGVGYPHTESRIDFVREIASEVN